TGSTRSAWRSCAALPWSARTSAWTSTIRRRTSPRSRARWAGTPKGRSSSRRTSRRRSSARLQPSRPDNPRFSTRSPRKDEKDRAMNVGVIGAGRMGTPIIGHLVRKGFATRVFDLDAAKAGAVKGLGAKWAASLEALSAESDAILICVGFDREVQDLLAAGGALRQAKAGTIVAILSTIHPE